MQPYTNSMLLALLLFLTAAAIAVSSPHQARTLARNQAHTEPLPHTETSTQPPQKRDRIRNLPTGYKGIFVTFISICPNLPSTANLIHFYQTAATLSATDPSPGRQHQRFTFGGLALELVAWGKDEIVSKEFVQATSLWLADAAMKGWTGFFRAWLKDSYDGQVVEVTMGTVWDIPADDTLPIAM